ncbi:MAG: transcription termination factor NusA [Candidatus Eremiobacteraeota bacterium]|nr:transcription termination factor NusA [Candidatus Eremiobacteraeota bacterium]
MNGDLISALKQIERERNIPLDTLKEAVEQALTSSYRKTFNVGDNYRVEIDWKSGGIKVIATMNVVSRRKDLPFEISLSQARKKMKNGYVVKIHPLDPSLLPDLGDEAFVPEEDELFLGMDIDVVMEENPKNFGRIAAQTTKQVIMQKIREAERDIIFSEYAEKEGKIISGTIQRNEHRSWIVELGKVEGIIPPHEQAPNEHFRRGERVKAYALKVEQAPKGPQVVLSRTHPGLIKRLFELEVPEIQQGLIEIHNVVREPGARSKVSVRAIESNVDPLGACVGPRGSRVQMIVDELRGEKIDIINHTEDPFTFVSNALSPARVLTVTLNPDDNTALVIVPDNQFSLAIGKEGQNARLAAKLTGWKIDIKSESQSKDLEAQVRQEEEERKKVEDEKNKKEEEERKRIEEEEKKLKDEEERGKKEEEERLRREEEECLRKEEEEKTRLEEEEKRKLLENPPEIPEYKLKPGEELKLEAAIAESRKTEKMDKYLKEIPKDMPVEEYMAMIYRKESSDLTTSVQSQQPVETSKPKEPGQDSRPKKKKGARKKKKRRGQDFDEYY